MLTTQERRTVTAALMRKWSREGKDIGCLKSDLFSATDSMDVWVEANQASANQALPAAVRTGIAAEMKADLLYAVVRKRMGGTVDYER